MVITMPELLMIANEPTTVPRQRSSRRPATRRIVVGVVLPAMILAYLVVAGPTIRSATRSLAGASPVWLGAGLVATVSSMVAFAALRRQTLAVGGARVPLRRTVGLSYGAGAVHTTLPAGALFSTTYAFRHLRSWDVPSSTAAWSMTITGLLSTLTLSTVGLLGVALGPGAGGSYLWPLAEVLLVVAVVVGLVQVCRHPGGMIRLANLSVLRFNSFRERSSDSGLDRLANLVADLRAIRPTARDWMASTMLALANWALDLACLAACATAVGVHVGFPALLITYTAGMAAGSALPLPAGLGAVETAMTLGLTVAGAAASPALAAVLLYRLLSTGSVVVIGWVVVATQRLRSDGRSAGMS
ncbi:uncharacterized protein (TIRG00374 family) [Nakamurella sp. UYEF19]|uniref:lysylphosphatidylglycerol synthase transmembrane domain-containing protein n=1 Tax=Nakamurella sp. UYEF19 TaxID=1756392 RepID=UPI0033915730